MPIRSIIRRVPFFKTIVVSCGRWTLTAMSSGNLRVRNCAGARYIVDYQRVIARKIGGYLRSNLRASLKHPRVCVSLERSSRFYNVRGYEISWKIFWVEDILDHDPMGPRMLFLDMSFLVHLDKEQDMRLSLSELTPWFLPFVSL